MSKLLEKAIAEIRKLPEERQEEMAAVALFLMNAETAPRLTPEQEAEVRASMAAREFLSDEDVEVLYRRYGV